jgi:serine phosphatase RsbU (regulator of sigma subunit)/anti-sigma regulatory factor (Ser/Thr protein kinase)
MRSASLSARPVRLAAAGIFLGGVLLTALATWATARADRNTEQRLLETQTRQAASVLSTAVLGIQQPMSAVLDAQALLPPEDGPEAFTRLLSEQVGPQKLYVSASLWGPDAHGLSRLASLGADPGMDPEGPDAQALVRRALGSTTSVVRRVEVGDRTRIAYALGDPDSGVVVYVERDIPEDRRSPVDSDSAYADLHYAIYLGSSTDTTDLTTTDVDPEDLPLTGLTDQETLAFGDTVLTLATSPRHHLGSSLSQRLPWFLLVGGLLLTTGVAAVARQLIRSRLHALSATETITALYERVDSSYAEQRDVSVRLQRALLPSTLPDIPGIDIAAEYLAGAQGIDIGGDWYSAIALGEDTFGFVVGDVSGHGLDAVAEMARARFTLRAYLFDDAEPATALEKCARQFDISTDGHLVTALVGIANRRTGEVTVASAGHPAPLLVTPGTATFIEVPVGLPLGAGRSSYESSTFTLPQGSTLVAYTDGLVERRGEDIDVGMRRLLSTVESAKGLALDDVVSAVLRSLEDSPTSDDVALLAIRRGTGASMRLPADTRAPGAARAFVEETIADPSVPVSVREDVVLIASELVTNAVKSGATQIAIDLTKSAKTVLLTVDDDGSGMPTVVRADDTDTSGRGLAIVDHLADEWKVIPGDHGKRVTAACSLGT